MGCCLLAGSRNADTKPTHDLIRQSLAFQASKKSVTVSMVGDHLRGLGSDDYYRCGIYLVEARVAAPDVCRLLDVEDARLALRASCFGVQSSVGDMVFIAQSGHATPFAAEVLAHMHTQPALAASNGHVALVRPYRCLENSVWEQMPSQMFVPIESIIGATIWAPARRGRRVIQLPCVEYRS